MNSQNQPPRKFYGVSSFTFDTFLVGDSNRFAHSVSLAVAENQVHIKYNPLLIYGESGVGKTHLLHAIGHLASKTFPDYNIVYVTCACLIAEIAETFRGGKSSEMRNKYKSADVLIMDDIQYIAGRIVMQDEVLEIFDTLYSLGKQIVLASNRPPHEMVGLSARLRSRFESGILVDIKMPDVDLCKAIITSKASQLGIVLPYEVKEYIAKNANSNICQIEGVVNTIAAFHEILNEEITVEAVARHLKLLFDGAKEQAIPSSLFIIKETAKYFQLTPDDLTSNRRSQNIMAARQVAMYLVRKLTNLSLKDIGKMFGGREHSTVLESVRRTEQRLKESPDFAKEIKDVVSFINLSICKY